MDRARFSKIGKIVQGRRRAQEYDRWKVELLRRWRLDTTRGLVEIRDAMVKEGWPPVSVRFPR